MKRIFFLITLLILITSINGYTKSTDYPMYEEIVNTFFDKYILDTEVTENNLKFEKTPNGWQIAIVQYVDRKEVVKSQLFWSRKKGKYVSLEFKKSANDSLNNSIRRNFLDKFDKRYFNLYPYYGYSGWSWDIIKDYSYHEKLDDNTLFALASSYSQHSTNLLNGRIGFPNKIFTFDLPPGKNCLKEDQLKEYKKYANLAISTYQRLLKQNENYKTIVGSIKVKLSNEYVTHFLNLRIYQNESEALKYLPEGLYSEFQIATAKNYLISCAQNSILFTNGDNDTFPLLYLQSRFGFRKDVLVINMSLFSIPKYINSFREQINDSKPLIFSLNTENIKDGVRDVILLYDRLNDYMDVDSAISFVNEDKNKLESNEYFYLLSKKFRLSFPNGNIEWTIKRNYLLKNHLMVLDLLSNNKGERPIYFAITLPSASYLGLSDYFELEGFAYRLVSNKKSDTCEVIGSVNTILMYTNLITLFAWEGMGSIEPHDHLMLMNYRNNFSKLANALISKNQLDSAKIVLDKCISVISNGILPYDQSIIPLIENYFKINNIDKASSIARKLTKNLNDDIDNLKGVILGKYTNRKNENYKRLTEILLTYNQNELIKELELNKYVIKKTK